LLESRWRPRIKPEHGLYRTPEGRVRVGGTVYGIAAEVDDPTGAVWTMLSAADGTRYLDEIVQSVQHAHPGEPPARVAAAVEQFAAAGYLDNAAAPTPAGLSTAEQQRYDRSRRFYRWIDPERRETSWDPQLRLKAARVVVLGAGGTGGTAALALAASGVGHLHIVDGDVGVELSNLNRQIQFDESDVGRPKAQVTAARLSRLNSTITVTSELATVTGEADLERLIDSCDVFVLCADEPGEIRAWTNRVCLRSGRRWVDAGYHGPAVHASAYVPGTGPCYECCWMQEHERRLAVVPQRVYSLQRKSTQAVTAVSAGLSGQFAAHLTIALITGVPAVAPGQSIGVNLAVPEPYEPPRFTRHPNCSACAAAS
jgi:molybdopterin/thiamine biosynthesis adenylyltransferase